MAAGTTKTELPRRGEILRYVYLFLRESRDRDEGIKERPVVVIDADPATRRVAVLAITTKDERSPGAIMLPDAVASAAGLSRPGSGGRRVQRIHLARLRYSSRSRKLHRGTPAAWLCAKGSDRFCNWWRAGYRAGLTSIVLAGGFGVESGHWELLAVLGD